MNRFASALLLLGGAVMLITLQVSPATSAPVARVVEIASPLDQVSPLLIEVNAQVERMRERLDARTDYPPPTRDPFSFGARAERVRAAPPPPPPTVPAVAAPMLPRLVAVLSTATDGGMSRTAVFAAGDDVQLVAPGDRIGLFVVRSIAGDAVTLVDPTSGAAFRVQ